MTTLERMGAGDALPGLVAEAPQGLAAYVTARVISANDVAATAKTGTTRPTAESVHRASGPSPPMS